MPSIIPILSATSLGVLTFEDFPDVTPFTIKSGYSFEGILSDIRTWIRDELVPYLNDTTAASVWQANAKILSDAVEAALAAQDEKFTEAFGDHFVGSMTAPTPTGDPAVDTPNLLAAIAAAKSSGYDLRITPSPLGAIRNYKLNQPLTWSLSRGTWQGVGDCGLDFSAVSTSYVGAAITVYGEAGDFSRGAHLGATHKIAGFRMYGHNTDASNMDAFYFHDAVPDPSKGPTATMGNVDQGTVEMVQALGFRDGYTFGDHVWSIEFHKCAVGNFHRYGINLQMGVDAGESIRLVGTSFYGGTNAAKNAAAIYAPASTNVEFAMTNGSLDYNDIEGVIYGGNLAFNDVHIEDNRTGAMFVYKQTGPGGISVAFKDCSWDSSASAPRPYIHQILSGSGSNVLVKFDGDKGGVAPNTRSVWMKDDSGTSDYAVTVLQRAHTVTGYHLLGQVGNCLVNGTMETSPALLSNGPGTLGWWAAPTTGSTWTLGAGGSPGSGLRVVATQATNHYAQQMAAIPLGRPIWVGGKIFVNAITQGGAEILIDFFAADGTTQTGSGGRVGDTVTAQSTDWSLRTRRYLPPAGSAFMRVRLSAGNFIGTATFDELEVIPL